MVKIPYESITPLISELERFGQWFMSQKCDIPTTRLTVNIQTRGRRTGLCGWFKENAWSTKEGEKVHEIILTAEALQRDTYAALETMAHECVHYWNNFIGIKDCSKSGSHNARFKESAETAGLHVSEERDKRHGWNDTSLPDDLRKSIDDDFQVDHTAFNLFREVVLPAPKPTKQKLWECQCPVKVRVAIELDAHCNVCDYDFEKQEIA